jgi:hypothetical protein
MLKAFKTAFGKKNSAPAATPAANPYVGNVLASISPAALATPAAPGTPAVPAELRQISGTIASIQREIKSDSIQSFVSFFNLYLKKRDLLLGAIDRLREILLTSIENEDKVMFSDVDMQVYETVLKQFSDAAKHMDESLTEVRKIAPQNVFNQVINLQIALRNDKDTIRTSVVNGIVGKAVQMQKDLIAQKMSNLDHADFKRRFEALKKSVYGARGGKKTRRSSSRRRRV